ncbi:HAD-superfamily hydrolase, subfamily IIB [Artemisia annua]|uniref:Trehalose 6-phosphate phosphatase n=1 Tax=Artemisia annua TaxID=35608 RepID=A0A2U1PKF8_ARTAN|nr:HAD-superfamily hydrolase, subfamily IIB [Artemisia annua]
MTSNIFYKLLTANLIKLLSCSYLFNSIQKSSLLKVRMHKTNHSAPILADPTPITKPKLGIHDSILPYSSAGVFSQSPFLTVPWKKPGVLDDVLSTSWLDAMKSSSPRNLIKNNGNDFSSNDVDLAYLNWMLKYPSALTSFEQIANNARGKRIALFLDYDGTLSPIVDNPDHAFMSSAMRAAVRNVAKYVPTAIISGRSREKVRKFVGLKELYYAGSHGMDIMAPDQPPTDHTTEVNAGNLYQPASEFLPMMNEVFVSLVEITKNIEGVKVEDNKFAVSVHYRNVDEKNWETVAQYVHDTMKNYPRLRLTHGRMVLEVRPVLKWDKGKAVEFLLESLGLSNCDDVLPIYVGDDRTDEDAFKFLRESNRGFGILVSPAPRESNAYYSLKDTSEVMEFINSLVMYKKSVT